MGYRIDDPEKAAALIKAISEEMRGIGFGEVSVKVRRSPARICVAFYDYNGSVVCSFELHEQTNCCGAMVSTRTFVAKDLQGQGIAQSLMPLKEAIAKAFGYSALTATANMTNNAAEIHILEKFGWKLGWSFTNRRTDHLVGFYFKSLEA